MFKWLFGKRIDRTGALEAYLSLFSAEELSYLNDLSVTGVAMRLANRDGDVMREIEITAFIHAALRARRGEIPEDLPSYAGARTSVRMALAREATAIGRTSGVNVFHALDRLQAFRTGQEAASPEDDERLSLHGTMLGRIYDSGTAANLLPELDRYGEGRAWEKRWRTAGAPG